MDMTMETCRKFVEVLASDAPAPGGGGAAAGARLLRFFLREGFLLGQIHRRKAAGRFLLSPL